jgi:hypothetical protein
LVSQLSFFQASSLEKTKLGKREGGGRVTSTQGGGPPALHSGGPCPALLSRCPFGAPEIRGVFLHWLSVTVCHYPPGASKWNPIEHRLFSQLTKHWAGKPLEIYETVLKYIRRTRTAAGLRVQARLTRKRYEKGQTATDTQLSQIGLRRHATSPDWNYTIHPGKM